MLDDFGITRKQSMRWQAMARVPVSDGGAPKNAAYVGACRVSWTLPGP